MFKHSWAWTLGHNSTIYKDFNMNLLSNTKILLISYFMFESYDVILSKIIFTFFSKIKHIQPSRTDTVSSIITCQSVQLFSHVQLFTNPWTAARQAPLSVTNSWSLHKVMSIDLVMPSNISSSAAPFSFCFQSFPESAFFPMSLLVLLPSAIFQATS